MTFIVRVLNYFSNSHISAVMSKHADRVMEIYATAFRVRSRAKIKNSRIEAERKHVKTATFASPFSPFFPRQTLKPLFKKCRIHFFMYVVFFSAHFNTWIPPDPVKSELSVNGNDSMKCGSIINELGVPFEAEILCLDLLDLAKR